jgi:glycosyltransferase
MKFSIVTVSYNSAATIADTLRSVCSQTHADIEHLIIDGGSTDDTLAVVRREGAHVARLVSEPDRGIYDAMNKGLALATGELVGFLNADDMLASPDTIAALAAAAAGANADVLYGDLLYVHKDRPGEVVRYWRSGGFAASRLRYGWMPPHPTLYVRRSVQQALGGFDLRLRIAADYDFMLRCLSAPALRIGYLPRVLVHMRTGGASNRSLRALRDKSREDLFALRKNQVGGWFSLLCKNARKLPQYFSRPRAGSAGTPPPRIG